MAGFAANDPLHTSQGFSIGSVRFMPGLGLLAATIDPTDYGREDAYDDDPVDEDHSGISDNVPTRSDDGESTRSVRVVDELTTAEVGWSRDTALGVGA